MTGPSRGERAAIGMLCRLLPEGFRDRQRGEWTGDLVALAGSGAGVRWRYLLAAAWTLPALRASARRAGLDGPHAMVPLSLPAALVARVILVGLGVPVLSWLIAVPLRYVLLDVPGRIAAGGPFDPKDLWPMDGPFLVLIPLWVALSLGAWAALWGWLLLTWVALVTAVLGGQQRGASRRHRTIAIACAPVLVLLGFAGEFVRAAASAAGPDNGLALAIMGGGAVIFGTYTRGLSRRRRVTVLALGIAAMAIFAWNNTPIGAQMRIWYFD